jgi:hypothetical protein
MNTPSTATASQVAGGGGEDVSYPGLGKLVQLGKPNNPHTHQRRSSRTRAVYDAKIRENLKHIVSLLPAELQTLEPLLNGIAGKYSVPENLITKELQGTRTSETVRILSAVIQKATDFFDDPVLLIL